MNILTINNEIIRNYMIAMAIVGIASTGVGELFYSPIRLAKEREIKQYAPYVGAGVVNYGKNFVTDEGRATLP